MIETIAIALRDDTVFKIYIAAMMAVMVGPMVLLTIYYHANISRSDGGKALMREQAKHAPGVSGGTAANLGATGRMAKDISAGRYGQSVRRLQNKTYLFVALWLAANIVMWAIPMVSMSMYPDPSNPPGLRPQGQQK